MDLEMQDYWPSQPGDFKNQHLLPWQQVSKNHIIDSPPCNYHFRSLGRIIFKICQIIVGTSMICQIYDFFFQANFRRVFAIWKSLCGSGGPNVLQTNKVRCGNASHCKRMENCSKTIKFLHQSLVLFIIQSLVHGHICPILSHLPINGKFAQKCHIYP